ncbi:MAG: hypothetical protein UIM27_06560 [Acutalibacteraceae bacterium]|nr:hypothetical protein [Acutalibacteraceae bacterium]
MKSRKRFRIVFMVIIVVVIAIFFLWQSTGRDSFGLRKSGSLYENMSDFSLNSTGNPDELTQTFLENIKYEVKNIDKEEMVATVEVSVPIISNELSNVIDNVISENSEKNYDELKQIVKNELISILKSERIETQKTVLSLTIEKIDNSYKFVPSEEWNELLTKDLENLYLSYLEILIGEMDNEVSK